jgi:hypothetical protein
LPLLTREIQSSSSTTRANYTFIPHSTLHAAQGLHVQVAVSRNLDRGFTWAGGKGQYQPNK